MNKLEKRFQEAVSQFEDQNYRQSICEFTDLYRLGYRKNQIMSILMEACFLPNEEEMRENYQANSGLLQQYPFRLGGNFCSFDELPFLLYPISETEFYIYQKDQDRFTGIYQFDDGTPFDLHSEPINSALFLENELNYSHLRYLNDTIRKSEDLAYDNHIYLFYSGFEDLAKLLLVTRLDKLLEEQKFVFLLGEEYRNTPIDFKAQFGIDYAVLEPKPLSVGDIKRIIFGWKIANVSGTSFLADIMDFHPDLLTIPDCVMYSFVDFYQNQLAGRTAAQVISFLKKLPDSDGRKQFVTGLTRLESETYSQKLLKELNRVSPNQFLDELEFVLSGVPRPDAKEWLIAIYLTYARCHERKFGRVIPALFVYPHDDMFYLAGVQRESIKLYFGIIQSFPYHKIIAVIRDPVTQAGAVINFMTHGHPSARNAKGEIQLDPFYCFAFGSILPKDYYFPLQNPLRESMAVVRFEDLKLNPEATFESMAEFLNIPVAETMYHTTWCGLTRMGVNSENVVFDGFDPAPVYKTYEQNLSVFDKYRVELLLMNRIKAYGYMAKYYDGQQFSDEEVLAMMELPFLCESMPTVIPPQQKQSSRDTGMSFIQFALAIKNFPFTVNGSEEQFAPLKWLRPKEDKLREPLYKTRG